MVKILTKQLWMPIGWLFGTTHGGQCQIVGGTAVVLWFMWKFLPSGLHDPGFPKVSSLVPMVKSSQFICHSKAFKHQDSPVTFPGSMALESINVVPKHEHYEVS